MTQIYTLPQTEIMVSQMKRLVAAGVRVVVQHVPDANIGWLVTLTHSSDTTQIETRFAEWKLPPDSRSLEATWAAAYREFFELWGDDA
jgi:hypothetical protein